MMRRCALLPAAMLLLSGVALPAQGDERTALDTARRAAALADARAGALAAAAARAGSAADRARAAAAAAAAEVQASEAAVAAAASRLVLVRARQEAQRAALADRRQPLVRLAAALETMARRPPALALVQPGSLRDIVHVRALLGSSIPAITARTADLRQAMATSARLADAEAHSAAALQAQRRLLVARRTALAQVEIRERARSASLAGSAALERDRALALAARAKTLGALVGSLNEQATLRERLAALPGPLPRPSLPAAAGAPPPAAVAIAGQGRPVGYRLPVIGRLVSGMGEMTDGGIRTRGLVVATAPLAQVVAPAAGRVVFADRFRGYGTLVILDHGGGWTTALTNLSTAAVRVGDELAAGSPVGRAGPGRPTVGVELRRGEQAVDVFSLSGRG